MERLLPLLATRQALDELRLAREARPAAADDHRGVARVLQAFKTQDPNGNGKADEIPLSSERPGQQLIPYLMNAFVYDPVRAPTTVPRLARSS